ncbi:hypothetical protein [Bacillus sp. AFS059628]|uniref:hypothetical protein n=1 Tax=Bacillus sp. AFS059628 TaxID=2033508 RepID=UPI0015D4E834|nr:hypothetical protein [Bacillus sp. AFS059628]
MNNQTEGTNKQSVERGVMCKYGEDFYPDGVIICINGKNKKCRNGHWESLGTTCRDMD